MNHLGHIPVGLLQYSLEKHIWKYLRTFLALKYAYTSTAVFTNDDEKVLPRVLSHLGICGRTFRRHLDKLMNLGFLGRDRNQVYYLRSYKRIEQQFGLPKTRKVEFTTEHIVKHNFVPYLVGSVVGYMALRYKFGKRREELKKDGLHQSRLMSKIKTSDYACALSARFLAFRMGLSKSSINHHLKIACELNYVYCQADIEPFFLPLSELAYLKGEWESGQPYPIIYKGCICLRGADRYLPILSYKKNRH